MWKLSIVLYCLVVLTSCGCENKKKKIDNTHSHEEQSTVTPKGPKNSTNLVSINQKQTNPRRIQLDFFEAMNQPSVEQAITVFQNDSSVNVSFIWQGNTLFLAHKDDSDKHFIGEYTIDFAFEMAKNFDEINSLYQEKVSIDIKFPLPGILTLSIQSQDSNSIQLALSAPIKRQGFEQAVYLMQDDIEWPIEFTWQNDQTVSITLASNRPFVGS